MPASCCSARTASFRRCDRIALLNKLGDVAPLKDDAIAVVDPVPALACFPDNQRWQQFVESGKTQSVTSIAEMLHIGVFACRAMLGKKIQSGTFAVR